MNKAYIFAVLTPCIILTVILTLVGVALVYFNDSDEQFKVGKSMIYLSIGIMVVITIACLIIGAVVK